MSFESLIEQKFNRSEGYRIEYLTVLFAEHNGKRVPNFAWMQTSDTVWHRFFIDAFMPHWTDLDSDEAKKWLSSLSETQTIDEFIEEELEEYEDESSEDKTVYKWSKENLLCKFNLGNKKFLNAESKFFKLNGLNCTQLRIDIEDDNQIIWNEYDDKKDEELIVNGNKL